MNVIGPFKKNAIAYSTLMASGKSDWLTREELMDSLNAYTTYDKVDVTPCPEQETRGTLWYGFRLKAYKEGKPERMIILEGEVETLKAKEEMSADTLYYFEDKQIYDFVWIWIHQYK
jgi:hypothetical protein